MKFEGMFIAFSAFLMVVAGVGAITGMGLRASHSYNCEKSKMEIQSFEACKSDLTCRPTPIQMEIWADAFKTRSNCK